jgi:hypothetical protein
MILNYQKKKKEHSTVKLLGLTLRVISRIITKHIGRSVKRFSTYRRFHIYTLATHKKNIQCFSTYCNWWTNGHLNIVSATLYLISHGERRKGQYD